MTEHRDRNVSCCYCQQTMPMSGTWRVALVPPSSCDGNVLKHFDEHLEAAGLGHGVFACHSCTKTLFPFLETRRPGRPVMAVLGLPVSQRIKKRVEGFDPTRPHTRQREINDVALLADAADALYQMSRLLDLKRAASDRKQS